MDQDVDGAVHCVVVERLQACKVPACLGRTPFLTAAMIGWLYAAAVTRNEFCVRVAFYTAHPPADQHRPGPAAARHVCQHDSSTNSLTDWPHAGCPTSPTSLYTVKKILISTDILWPVNHILTEPVPPMFVSVNRRNNEALDAHFNVGPRFAIPWINGYFYSVHRTHQTSDHF